MKSGAFRLMALFAAAFPLAAAAAEVRPIVKAGYDFGGETLVTVFFTDGSSERIKANEGLYLGGGAVFASESGSMEFHLTLAYKMEMVDGRNGDAEWTRIPLEALAFYRFPKARVGGGLAYHLSPSLEGSGTISALDIDFKDALGVVLQADYRFTDRLAAGLRYTMMEYEAKAPFSGKAKTDGVGITFSYAF
jgi:hypothetical protein